MRTNLKRRIHNIRSAFTICRNIRSNKNCGHQLAKTKCEPKKEFEISIRNVAIWKKELFRTSGRKYTVQFERTINNSRRSTILMDCTSCIYISGATMEEGHYTLPFVNIDLFSVVMCHLTPLLGERKGRENSKEWKGWLERERKEREEWDVRERERQGVRGEGGERERERCWSGVSGGLTLGSNFASFPSSRYPVYIPLFLSPYSIYIYIHFSMYLFISLSHTHTHTPFLWKLKHAKH